MKQRLALASLALVAFLGLGFGSVAPTAEAALVPAPPRAPAPCVAPALPGHGLWRPVAIYRPAYCVPVRPLPGPCVLPVTVRPVTYCPRPIWTPRPVVVVDSRYDHGFVGVGVGGIYTRVRW